MGGGGDSERKRRRRRGRGRGERSRGRKWICPKKTKKHKQVYKYYVCYYTRLQAKFTTLSNSQGSKLRHVTATTETGSGGFSIVQLKVRVTVNNGFIVTTAAEAAVKTNTRSERTTLVLCSIELGWAGDGMGGLGLRLVENWEVFELEVLLRRRGDS